MISKSFLKVNYFFKLFVFIIIVILCALRHEVIKHSLLWSFYRLRCARSCVLIDVWLWTHSERMVGSYAFKASLLLLASLKLPTLPLRQFRED